MAHLDIIRAWKDEEYRLNLSDAERALLPAHPAGLIELTDIDMDGIDGGTWTTVIHTPAISVVITVIFSC